MRARKAPWLRRRDWTSRRLVVSGMPQGVASAFRWSGYVLMLVFVPVLVLFLAFIGYVTFFHVLRGESLATQLVAVGVLVAVAVGAGLWLRRDRRAGLRPLGTPLRPYQIGCQLRTLPGVIGGWFKADVEIEVAVRCERPILVALTCTLSGATGWASRSRRHLWTASYRVPARLEPFGDASFRMRLPVVFFLPTDILTHGRLEASQLCVEVEGPDQSVYRALFGVPIFDTTEAPPHEQQLEDAPTPEIVVRVISVRRPR